MAEAADDLRHWLAVHPEDADAWAILGAAHFELEQWEDAELAARRVTDLRPDSPRHWSNLGTVLRKLGDLSGAESAQRHALSLDPDYSRAYGELGKIHEAGATGVPEFVVPPPASPAPQPAPAQQPAVVEPAPAPAVAPATSAVPYVLGGLLTLLVVGVVAFGLGLFDRDRPEQEAEAPVNVAEARALTPEELRLRASELERLRYEIDQQMLRNTIEYVDRHLTFGSGGEERTEAQRAAVWDEQFQDRWVRWEGAVVEVSDAQENCSVSIACRPSSTSADAQFPLDRDTAQTLSKGQRVRVEAQLRDCEDETTYQLANARIVAKW